MVWGRPFPGGGGKWRLELEIELLARRGYHRNVEVRRGGGEVEKGGSSGYHGSERERCTEV